MGGNVFKDRTQSIKKENIEPTVKKYFKELSKVFPQKKDMFSKEYLKYVGSVGKKAESGDIDFAIDTKSIIKDFSDESIMEWGLNPEEVKEQMLKYKKRARTATDEELTLRAILKGIVTRINLESDNIYSDEVKISAGSIFSLFPQYNQEGQELASGVQIDWMIGSLDLLEFSYYSEVYDGNVKGLHRTQLIVSVFNNIGVTYSHTKGIFLKGSKEIITKNPKEIIDYLNEKYRFSITREIIGNYFLFYEYLQENLPEDELMKIMNIYFRILSYTRTDIPYNVQDLWLGLNETEHYETKFLPEDSSLKGIK